jgi:hypothetical protein
MLNAEIVFSIFELKDNFTTRHAMRFMYITTLVAMAALLPYCSTAQRNLDAGFFFGISHYMGDLQQAHIEVLEIHQARGLFLRYSFNNHFSLKTQFYQGTISGSDASFPTIEPAWKRNLSFRSSLYELGIQGEYNFMNFGIRKQHYKQNLIGYVASAYVFGGISGFYFNPEANYQGEWYALQPLGTEGQGLDGQPDKYKLMQVAIPMGFGFKIRASKWSCIGFEIGFRKTFTDYLDDVSGKYPDLNMLEESNPMAATLSFRGPEVDANADPVYWKGYRGSPKGKDMFLFAGLLVAITLGK